MSPWDDEHPGYLTVAKLLRIYRSHVTSASAVYRLANREKWRRYFLDGRIRYHLADVDATFERAEVDNARAGEHTPSVDRPVGEHSPDDQHEHGDACPGDCDD